MHVSDTEKRCMLQSVNMSLFRMRLYTFTNQVQKNPNLSHDHCMSQQNFALTFLTLVNDRVIKMPKYSLNVTQS